MDELSASPFNSIKISVAVSNLTTRTPFKKKPETSLCEIDHERLVLEAPERSCALGHQLMLTLKVAVPGRSQKVMFSATGRVEEVEPVGESGGDRAVRLGVSLVQYEGREFSQFLGVFGERQSAINEFLRATKGFHVL